MTDENISVKISDNVDGVIITKIAAIASNAKEAATAVEKLKTQLGALRVGALNELKKVASSGATKALADSVKTDAAELKRYESSLKALDADSRRIELEKLAKQNQIFALQRQSAARAQQQNAAMLAEAYAMNKQHDALNKLKQQQLLKDEAAFLKQAKAENELNRQQAIQEINAKKQKSRSSGGGMFSGGIFRSAAHLSGAIGTAAGGAALLAASDRYTELQNKLRNVSENEAQVDELTKRIAASAMKTRTSVTDMTKSFVRFDMALVGMGKSQEDSLKMTENVAKMLVLSGTNAGEAGAAMLQLSQAFNKGKLDGDEFRSVMELMPKAADAIAKKLGVTRGELLKLAPQGIITSQIMFDAFMEASKGLDEGLGKTIPTIAQGFEVMKTGFISAFGEFNKSIGFTASLAEGMKWLGLNAKEVTVAVVALSTAMLTAFGSTMLAKVAALKKSIVELTAFLAKNPFVLIAGAIAGVVAYLVLFNDQIKITNEGFATLGDLFSAMFGKISSGFSAFYDAYLKGIISIDFESKITWASVLTTVANAVDGMSGFLKGLAIFSGRAVAETVLSVENLISKSFNKVVYYLETALNKIISVRNKMREQVGLSPTEFVKFDRMAEVGKSEFSSIGELWSQSLKDGFDMQGGVLEKSILDSIAKAELIAVQREKDKKLRGEGTAQLSGGSGKAVKIPKIKDVRESQKDNYADIIKGLREELTVVGMLNKERSIEEQVTYAVNKAKETSLYLTTGEENVLRSMITELENQRAIQAEVQNIYDSSAGSLAQLNIQEQSHIVALTQGYETINEFKNSILALNVARSQQALDSGAGTWADGWLVALSSVQDGFKSLGSAITDLGANALQTLSQGFSDSIGRAIVYSEDLSSALENVGKQILSSLISGLIQVGIQYAINQALSQSATAAITAESVAAAGVTAAAWGPAAAAVSLASFGANAVPANAAMLESFAVSKALTMPGFMQGGFTGNVGTSEVAGVVHGQEFVVNAGATSRNRDVLEAMNRGATAVSARSSTSGSKSGAGINVNIENYGVSKDFEVQQLSETEVRIIARDEAKAVVRKDTPAIVSTQIRDPNSPVSKSLGQNTQTQRRR